MTALPQWKVLCDLGLMCEKQGQRQSPAILAAAALFRRGEVRALEIAELVSQ